MAEEPEKPNVPEAPLASEAQLKAILHEADAIQAGINRDYNAIYTTFGVVLPALVGIFALAAKDLHFAGDVLPKVALAFVVVFSLSGLWAQSLWMDLLRYVKYRYVVLLPRLYHAVGYSQSANYLQWSGPRSPRNASAILFFNAGCWCVLLSMHVVFLSRSSFMMQTGSIVSIGAVTLSNIFVMREAADLEAAIEASARDLLEPSG